MNTRQQTFELLLAVSKGVDSVDDYYGASCAFCGAVNDNHTKDCQTTIALKIIKADYNDLYQKQLDDIAAQQELQRQKEIERQQQLDREYAAKHTKCHKCMMEVRRVDLSAHVDSKRCIKQQKKNNDNYGQMIV